MPTAADLRVSQRRDLLNAITNAGGFRAVADAIGRPSARKRRPAGFWTRDNAEVELLAFIDAVRKEEGGDGRMPTLAELRAASRVDLEQAVRVLGGFSSAAAVLGVGKKLYRREDGYWREFGAVEVALREFIEERDGVVEDGGHFKAGKKKSPAMPTQKQLRDAGRADLVSAITEFHGGLNAVSERMELKRKIPDCSEFYNLASEVLRLNREELNDLPVMPNSTVLRKLKRGDLLVAITSHGGMGAVSQRLGLQYIVRTREVFKKWDIFRRSLLAFTIKHGSRGKMPSSRELRNFGQQDLADGIMYWGGPRVVSEKVGLEVSNYWQYFHFVAWELLQFVERNGIPGVMPTESDFLDVGHATLNLATAKFGYSHVATRLGLREVGIVAQTALDTLVDQCLAVDDSDEDEDASDHDEREHSSEAQPGVSLLDSHVDYDFTPGYFGPPRKG